MTLFTLVVVATGLLLVRPWLKSFMYGTPVPMFNILAMRLRGNPPNLLIDAYIALRRAGEQFTIADVENAYIDNKNRIASSDELVALMKRD